MSDMTRLAIDAILDTLSSITAELDSEASLYDKGYHRRIEALRSRIGDLRLIENLEKAELPAYLTSPDPEIREAANIRMQQLKKDSK